MSCSVSCRKRSIRDGPKSPAMFNSRLSAPTYRGPAPVESRDILRRMALAIERIDKRRKRQRVDLTGLHGKLIKFVTTNLL